MCAGPVRTCVGPAGARFEIVSPAAHLATVERPDLTTAMILRFLSDE